MQIPSTATLARGHEKAHQPWIDFILSWAISQTRWWEDWNFTSLGRSKLFTLSKLLFVHLRSWQSFKFIIKSLLKVLFWHFSLSSCPLHFIAVKTDFEVFSVMMLRACYMRFWHFRFSLMQSLRVIVCRHTCGVLTPDKLPSLLQHDWINFPLFHFSPLFRLSVLLPTYVLDK